MALLVDIEKRLGDFMLKVSFEAGDGVTALLGASGSGKSMTCRCIAGIERPDRGPMRRGLLACGVQDMDRDCLFPVDERVEILGGSCDHTIVDLSRAPEYKVGDVLEFRLRYSAMMRAYTSAYVEKEYTETL